MPEETQEPAQDQSPKLKTKYDHIVFECTVDVPGKRTFSVKSGILMGWVRKSHETGRYIFAPTATFIYTEGHLADILAFIGNLANYEEQEKGGGQ